MPILITLIMIKGGALLRKISIYLNSYHLDENKWNVKLTLIKGVSAFRVELGLHYLQQRLQFVEVDLNPIFGKGVLKDPCQYGCQA